MAKQDRLERFKELRSSIHGWEDILVIGIGVAKDRELVPWTSYKTNILAFGIRYIVQELPMATSNRRYWSWI